MGTGSISGWSTGGVDFESLCDESSLRKVDPIDDDADEPQDEAPGAE